jgi:hypothetical protein
VHVLGGAKHCAFGGQAEPPVHDMTMSVWHTIAVPQSLSAVHEAAAQVPLGSAVPASAGGGVAAFGAQSAFAGHGFGAGVAVTVLTSSQVNPFPQSAEVLQVWPCATGATATRAVNAPTDRRIFVGDMRISVP